MKAPAALRISGLETRYGDKPVLRGVSLELAAGQIYGLLGPNGAGKTTLIRSICGRVKPVAGSISIEGSPNNHVLDRIGLVPQEIALYPFLTIEENLSLFGRLSGLSRQDTATAVAWAADAALLTSRLHERVEILSGGWKRRVNIAAAILHRPALLILDEPTVGVDVDARNGLHQLIISLSKTGMGVLLTTHDMEQAEALCSMVGFLHDGRLVLQGTPNQLLSSFFSGQKELVVELRQTPAAWQSAMLEKWGFLSHNGGLSWSLFGPYDEAVAKAVSSSLAQQGLIVRELRLREPGLDNLFMQITRQNSGMENAA
jgi:ABC-2 type transport system ATP-binding protein